MPSTTARQTASWLGAERGEAEARRVQELRRSGSPSRSPRRLRPASGAADRGATAAGVACAARAARPARLGDRPVCADLADHLAHVLLDPVMNGAELAPAALDALEYASHWPVIAGLFTSRMDHLDQPDALVGRLQALAVAHDVLALSSTSMIAARVAGVPRPVSFIASESSFSSSVLPAVSMAVSSVASVKRLGGRVFFAQRLDVDHVLRLPLREPGGSACSPRRPRSAFAVSFFALRGAMSSTFQPTCWTARAASV